MEKDSELKDAYLEEAEGKSLLTLYTHSKGAINIKPHFKYTKILDRDGLVYRLIYYLWYFKFLITF